MADIVIRQVGYRGVGGRGLSHGRHRYTSGRL